MSDVVLRIQGIAGPAIEQVRSFRGELASAVKTVAGLRDEYRTATDTVVADTRAQIAAQKEKVDAIRQEMAAVKELTGSYQKGSDERRIATQMEIDLQRKLQAALGETAAIASKGGSGARNTAERDASGFTRGAASRSGVIGSGVSALAGPGFLAGALIGGSVDIGVKAAEQEQAAQANLANAIRDTGNARKISKKALDDYLASEEHATGFTRDQVTQTLSMLIRSTGSLTTARKDEAIMANIARARQTDLSGAYMLVVKASEGNVGALKRLGIEVPKVTTYENMLKDAHVKASTALKEHAKQLDENATKTEVMRVVTQKFAGDSAAYMHTFGGETATLKNTFHDLEVEIGDKAIPMLTNLFGWIEKEKKAIQDSQTAHKIFHDTLDALKRIWADLVAGVHVFIDLMHNKFARDMTIAIGIVWALNAAITANPFIALATVAILAAGEIIRHWAGISGFFDKIWTDIKDAGKAAWALLVDLAKGAVYAILEYATAAVRGVLEVASHLPFVGGEAKRALNSINDYLNTWKPDFSNVTAAFAAGGTAAGQAFATNAEGGINTSIAGLTGGAAGVANPRSQAGGTQFGLVSKAKQLGVGSGGVYKLGGGHGGIAKPGTMLDCSGYVYQIFTQNGFKGFPGVSDDQWFTDKGPNWTSVRINVADAKPGDVVFMVGADAVGHRGVGHVGIITDGSGSSATVMQYYQTGMPPDTIPLSSIGDLVGIKRFYLIAQDKRGGAPQQPSPTSAADAAQQRLQKAFQAQLAAAPKTGVPKGLSAPSYTTLMGSITALLGTVPKGELDSIEREAVAQIKKIKDSLHVGMSAEDVAKDRVAITKWGKVLRDEIKAQATETKNAASEHDVVSKFKAAATVAQQAFDLQVLPMAQQTKLQGQIAAFKKLVRDAAADGTITSAELAAIKKSWSAMSSEMTAAATAVKNKLQTDFNNQWSQITNTVTRGISEAWALTQRAFDRETQATLQQMARDTSAHITQMQRAFQAQMTQFDRQTTAGLNSFVVAQTPEEKALADFQANRAAQQLAATQAQEQSNLAAAIASGNPQQIKQAQDAIQQTLLDIQEAALQKNADASRKAQDAKTSAQQQAYQDERDALKQQLTDQENAQEQAYQDSANAAAQAYQDQRDAQWQHLNDMHDDQVTALTNDLQDWGSWIGDKQKTYAAFLAWLAANPIGASLAGQLPSSFWDSYTFTATTLGAKPPESTPTPGSGTARPGKPQASWEGGVALRPTARMVGDQGPEAIIPLTSVSGQRALAQLVAAVAGAGGNGGPSTVVYGTFLGATERQVGRALEGLVTPQQARVVRYKAPLL